MKKIMIALVAAALVSCGSADQQATNTDSTRTTKDSTAAVDPASLTTIEWIDDINANLGKVKEGQVVEVSYRFRNSGTKNLILTRVNASCGCTVPEQHEKPYAPGEEGVIRAKFDSKGRPHGEAQKNVYVTANTNPGITTLSFKVEITD